MKNNIAILILSVLSSFSFGQTEQQISNQKTFTKLFGYVRYFHPSDEASDIDWDRFAVYGSSIVDKCKSQEELKAQLNNLFLPVAPSLKIFETKENIQFNVAEITPPDKNKFKTVAWQHLGIGFGNDDDYSPYTSARTNRPLIKKSNAGFGTLTMRLVDVNKYGGREFVFNAKVKLKEGNGSGHLWLRVDKTNGYGFFDNMDDRPITSKEWAKYSINGKIDDAAGAVYFGIFLAAGGELLIDSIELKVKGENGWETKFESNLKNDKLGEFPESIKRTNGIGKGRSNQSGYEFKTVRNDDTDDGKCISIKSVQSDDPASYKKVKHNLLFKKYAAIGEYIKIEIGSGLSCIMPLALYGDDEHTYPVSDSVKLNTLKGNIKSIPDSSLTGDNLYVRIADIEISWNIFQNFYLYFDIAKTNWADDLTFALTDAYHDKSNIDFQLTLQKLTAKLKDGHVRVTCESIPRKNYYLPLSWEWVENKLVITDIFSDSIQIHKGDIVTRIDGIPSEEYFKSIEEYISAATKGWMEYRADEESLSGYKNSETNLAVTNAEGIESNIEIKRTLSSKNYYNKEDTSEKIKEIKNDIYYINLDGATDSAINKLMPKLVKCKSIIFDLRGYPSVEPDLISHLLTQKDTSKMWMRVPQIIYPDEENIVGYQNFGWELKPKQPHLNAKIIFIVDGSAISYAESFMSFIENYKLATIIGQPTAGTNGNINPFTMPGGYTITWTGMKVFKHDGSQHHGIGIQPTILLSKTIKGVREGKDEFLDKAIELADK